MTAAKGGCGHGATVCTQPECKGQVVYTITSKGMEVDMQFFPNDALRRSEVGLLFELPPDFENLTYLGAGPKTITLIGATRRRSGCTTPRLPTFIPII